MDRFHFPPWLDRILPLLGLGAGAFGAYVAGLLYFGASPWALDVGYKPKQPVPFSHAIHAGKLKMDCRFCHNTVERAGHAAVPATSTCGKCHPGKDAAGALAKTSVHADSPKLTLVRESLATGKSIEWAKVHDLPDYAYFNHSAHVRRGVSCVSCHGRIDTMDEVRQVKPLSMSWCLECHRNPTPNLRPQEFITQLSWKPEDAEKTGAEVKQALHLNPQENCSTCHR